MKTLMKHFWRGIHILTTIIFVFSAAFLVYSLFSNYDGPIDNICAFILIIEAITVLANDGMCPLRNLHKKHEEKDESMMNLFFPEKMGKLLVRSFAVLTIIIFISWIVKEFLIN